MHVIVNAYISQNNITNYMRYRNRNFIFKYKKYKYICIII